MVGGCVPKRDLHRIPGYHPVPVQIPRPGLGLRVSLSWGWLDLAEDSFGYDDARAATKPCPIPEHGLLVRRDREESRAAPGEELVLKVNIILDESELPSHLLGL
ncbi:unnamed protein product [Diplocarpon coronariae]